MPSCIGSLASNLHEERQCAMDPHSSLHDASRADWVLLRFRPNKRSICIPLTSPFPISPAIDTYTAASVLVLPNRVQRVDRPRPVACQLTWRQNNPRHKSRDGQAPVSRTSPLVPRPRARREQVKRTSRARCRTARPQARPPRRHVVLSGTAVPPEQLRCPASAKQLRCPSARIPATKLRCSVSIHTWPAPDGR